MEEIYQYLEQVRRSEKQISTAIGELTERLRDSRMARLAPIPRGDTGYFGIGPRGVYRPMKSVSLPSPAVPESWVLDKFQEWLQDNLPGFSEEQGGSREDVGAEKQVEDFHVISARGLIEGAQEDVTTQERRRTFPVDAPVIDDTVTVALHRRVPVDNEIDDTVKAVLRAPSTASTTSAEKTDDIAKTAVKIVDVSGWRINSEVAPLYHIEERAVSESSPLSTESGDDFPIDMSFQDVPGQRSNLSRLSDFLEAKIVLKRIFEQHRGSLMSIGVASFEEAVTLFIRQQSAWRFLRTEESLTLFSEWCKKPTLNESLQNEARVGSDTTPSFIRFRFVCHERTLVRKFKHAPDFGVCDRFSKSALKRYGEVLMSHVRQANDRYIGHYRGRLRIAHVEFSRVVWTEPDGVFFTGYRATSEQLRRIVKMDVWNGNQ